MSEDADRIAALEADVARLKAEMLASDRSFEIMQNDIKSIVRWLAALGEDDMMVIEAAMHLQSSNRSEKLGRVREVLDHITAVGRELAQMRKALDSEEAETDEETPS